jgi:monoamine oxidase
VGRTGRGGRETPRGTIRARRAVVTVPVGVLKAGSVRFAPELPDETREALEGLRMGALTKMALAVDRARLDLPGEDEPVRPRRAWLRDELRDRPRGQDVVFATLGGDRGRRSARWGRAAR